MSKIDSSAFRDWNDGDTMHQNDYEQEREIIRTAINDNYTRLMKNFKVVNSDGSVAATQNLDTAINYIQFKKGANIDLSLDTATATIIISVKQGSGSNLDADKLDGNDSTYFAKQSDLTTINNNISINTSAITTLQNKYGSGVATAVQEYKWTATEGQTVFTLPSGQTYQPKSNTLWVTVGGAPQILDSGFTETDKTKFTLSEGVKGGTFVEARWFQGVSLASNLLPNVTDLPGYSTNVDDRIGSLSEIVLSAKDHRFGLIGDGISDDTTALQSLIDYANGLTGKKVEVVFPPGTYLYSQSPNWGIPNLKLVGKGEVIFKYTGSDKAFIVDASPDAVRRFYDGIVIDNIIIQGNANCLYGFYQRNIVRSTFKDIEVREINPATGKAFSILFGVSNLYINPTHSVNRYSTPNMAYDGFFIQNTDVGGDKPTNNTIINPKMEGASIGIRVFVGDNHNFIGGTSEGNGIYGIVTGAETRGNKFVGMALEANGTADIADSGKLNSFDGCYTQKDVLIQASSEQSKIVGGFHQKITIDASAQNPVVEDIAISQYTTGGSVVHNNNQTARIRNIKDWQTGVWVYGQIAMNPKRARTGITVGASPFTFNNTTQFPMLVNISGGDIYKIQWGNGGDVFEIAGSTTLGSKNGQFLLMPGDYLIVQYNTAPTMNYIPR